MAEITNIEAIPHYRDTILGQNFIKICHIAQKSLEGKHTDIPHAWPYLK